MSQPELPNDESGEMVDADRARLDMARVLLAAHGQLDLNVLSLIQEYTKRAEHGKNKYGVTTERTDLNLRQWLQHLKEELMDATVYIERVLKEKLPGDQ